MKNNEGGEGKRGGGSGTAAGENSLLSQRDTGRCRGGVWRTQVAELRWGRKTSAGV